MATSNHVTDQRVAPGSTTLREPSDGRLLELADVSFSYRPDEPVLDRVSFSVDSGEFVCVVGPSGCGKSTLLRILSGLQQPTSGSLRVRGADVYGGDAPQLPPLGYVFQEPRLLPWRTVSDNIRLALDAAGVPREEHEETIDRYLTMLHIPTLRDAWPLMISGGQRQRVAIGRALAIDPLYILMDEPFSALDELTARTLREELLNLWQGSGKTIVFVTHSVREAVYLADRIVVFTTNPGRLFTTVDVDLARPRALDSTDLLELEAHVVRTAVAEWDRARGLNGGSGPSR